MNGQGPESVGQKCSQYEACLECPKTVIFVAFAEADGLLPPLVRHGRRIG